MGKQRMEGGKEAQGKGGKWEKPGHSGPHSSDVQTLNVRRGPVRPCMLSGCPHEQHRQKQRGHLVPGRPFTATHLAPWGKREAGIELKPRVV